MQKSGNTQRCYLSFKGERGDREEGRMSQGIINSSASIPGNILEQINKMHKTLQENKEKCNGQHGFAKRVGQTGLVSCCGRMPVRGHSSKS